MRAIHCPYLYCNNIKRNGTRNGRQRYLCHDSEAADAPGIIRGYIGNLQQVSETYSS